MEKNNKTSFSSLLGSQSKIQEQRKSQSQIINANKRSLESTRSKLSTATFIKWLKSRFQSSLPKRFPYLYLPDQLTRQTSIEQIFTEFDSDGSGGLSRDEVYDMFRGFGINITMDHLNQLYDSVEVNLEELDCEMFKKCALGEKSNKVFREIVRQIEFDSCELNEEQKRYLPHNFTNMIIYLVYLSKRQQFKNKIEKQKIPIEQKVSNLENLLKLRDLSLNNEKLTLHTENMRKHLRNRFRDVWDRVNQKYGHKFPLSPKIEEEFYRFYLRKQGLLQSDMSIVSTQKNLERTQKSITSKKMF